jgi:hypothetical protein
MTVIIYYYYGNVSSYFSILFCDVLMRVLASRARLQCPLILSVSSRRAIRRAIRDSSILIRQQGKERIHSFGYAPECLEVGRTILFYVNGQKDLLRHALHFSYGRKGFGNI